MSGQAEAHRRRDAVFTRLTREPLLMGIVNVTPDSFSDGGRFLDPAAALAETHRHVEEGAAIIDVGAESTRPGHAPISEAEEHARLAPVLSALVEAAGVAVSIDTTKASIARVALEAGVAFVNDQWGLQGDPEMAPVAAAYDAGVVIMHNRGGALDDSLDIIADMRRFFERSLDIAASHGIPPERIVLDPGIGFGKTKTQNIIALGAGIAALKRSFGLPVLVGASRKSLFAKLIGAAAPEDRLIGTLAAHLAARTYGADLFRVHDCAPHRDALLVHEAIANQVIGDE